MISSQDILCKVDPRIHTCVELNAPVTLIGPFQSFEQGLFLFCLYGLVTCSQSPTNEVATYGQ